VADPKIPNGAAEGWGWGMGKGLCPLPRNFLKILCKNHAFWCKIFTCFKMHLVNRHGGRSPLESATGRIQNFKFGAVRYGFFGTGCKLEIFPAVANLESIFRPFPSLFTLPFSHFRPLSVFLFLFSSRILFLFPIFFYFPFLFFPKFQLKD